LCLYMESPNKVQGFLADRKDFVFTLSVNNGTY
jgi:hypothetical protein